MASSRSLRKGQVPACCKLCEVVTKLSWKCMDCDILMCDRCKERRHSALKNADKHKVVDVKNIGLQTEELDFSNIKYEDHKNQPSRAPQPPQPPQTPVEQRHAIIRDFLRIAMHGLEKIAHGEGTEKAELDSETEGYLQQNTRDFKKAQASRAPSTGSISSNICRLLLAPPPSRAFRITAEPPVLPPVVRTRQPPQTPVEQRHAIIRNFLRRAMHGLDKVAHAEGTEKAELDSETEGYIQQNIRDIKKAQKEVFGKTLGPGEFDKMPPKKQQDTSEKMIKLMQKWREERRAKELAKKR